MKLEEKLTKILADLDANEGQSELIKREVIYKYYDSKNEEVRWLVAEILFWDSSPKAIKILSKLMRDQNWLVRCEAFDSLSNKNNPKVLNELFHFIQSNKEENEIVYTYAIQTFFDVWQELKAINESHSDRFLLTILTNWFHAIPYKHPRITIAALLYKLGETDFVAYIRQQLADDSYQTYAEITLERLELDG